MAKSVKLDKHDDSILDAMQNALKTDDVKPMEQLFQKCIHNV